MDGQFLLSQAADLERRPTQLELETELLTPGKSGREQSSSSKGALSNARGRERGLAAVQSEFYSFRDCVKGELEDMKSSMKELLQELRKQRPEGTPAPSSEVATTSLEERPLHEETVPAEVVGTRRRYSE